MSDVSDIIKHLRNVFDVDDVDGSILDEIAGEVRELESRGINVTGDVIDKIIELHSSEIMGKVFSNVKVSMPGRSKLRRALPYLFKEAMERSGLSVELCGTHEGKPIDAAVKVGMAWIPVSLNYAEKSEGERFRAVRLSYDPRSPSGSDFIIDMSSRPPYYEMLLSSKVLGRLREGVRLHGVRFSIRGEVLYNIWRFYRERRYLVVPGPRIGMQLYDLEIVGFNRYLIKMANYVPKLPAKQYASYSRVVIITSKGRSSQDGKLLVLPIHRLVDLLDGDGIL